MKISTDIEFRVWKHDYRTPPLKFDEVQGPLDNGNVEEFEARLLEEVRRVVGALRGGETLQVRISAIPTDA
jgi:hypothetical protein